MLKTHELMKTFGARAALAGITLHIKTGEWVWLIGPNGAGKTTLVRILATLSLPTSGALYIAGLDAHRGKNMMKIRRQIGFLSHQTLLYGDLSAEQNLAFYAHLYNVSDSRTRIAELLGCLGLLPRRRDLVRTFSKGMQQRLAIARAVIHRPRILLLDEAYTGLDISASQILTSILNDLSNDGCTLILTAHDKKRIEKDEVRRINPTIQPRIITLRQGRILTED